MILERSNLFEADYTNFEKDYITYREEIYSIDIEKLTEKEIKNTETMFYKKVHEDYHRNGIELVTHKGKTSLNLLIIDYPTSKEWKSDVFLQGVINFISNNFDEIKRNEKEKVYGTTNIRNVIEVNAHSVFDFQNKNMLYEILNDNEVKFDIIYEETSVFNAGASGGAFRVILNLVGDSASVIAVLEFLKIHFSYDNDPVQLYSIKDIKKSISKQYEVHEDQLTLVSYEYNDAQNQMAYIFQSRFHKYSIAVVRGKIIKSSREGINEES